MLKQWQSTEIGFDFESVDPAEIGPGPPKALVGQKDYFVSHTGKFLSLMKKPRRSVEP